MSKDSIVIDIGPTQRRVPSSPRDLWTALANPTPLRTVGHVADRRAFSSTITVDGSDHTTLGRSIKVAGSPIVLPPQYRAFTDLIYACAKDHADNVDFDYNSSRALLYVSQISLEPGKTNVTPHLHLDTLNTQHAIAGNHKRRSVYSVSDALPTQFFMTPVCTTEVEKAYLEENKGQSTILDNFLQARLGATDPTSPDPYTIVNFNEMMPHQAKTAEEPLRRTFFAIVFDDYFTDHVCGDNPALNAYASQHLKL
ncbi:MAG: hypothetical protein V4621_05160 [Pseudomonadota bacterium]